MPTNSSRGRTFDARPDRVDYRDLAYRAPLRSLPETYPRIEFIRRHFREYGSDWILDQGQEGACTGFGLAALINYLLWKQKLATEVTVDIGHSEYELRANAVWRWKADFDPANDRVSMRMLYQMARIYDEWPGEDYEGSSCRGAMKGWHRHGVCTDATWKYNSRRATRPREGWEVEAAQRPLGAYYRINKDSIADLQAAIYEVGAIYASAAAHEGWFLRKRNELPVIEQKKQTGGHAFALVGYTPLGFVVQNSWGADWGYHGFAVLTYQDWVENGSDAWVAVLGAAVKVDKPGRALRSKPLRDVADGKAEWWWSSDSIGRGYEYRNPEVEPLSEGDAYEHTVVLGNNGAVLNRFVDTAGGREAVEEVVFTRAVDYFAARDAKPRLAVYAHGGLNDEAVSIERIRLMAPYFIENGIYPIFVTWRTGLQESIVGILEDAVRRLLPVSGAGPDRGWLDEVRDQLSEAKDRTIEAAADRVLIKPVWAQMKQNAAAASRPGGGMTTLARRLEDLRGAVGDVEIHLAGHSAGSILLGHLLSRFPSRGLTASSVHLYAPACTVPFANRHYAGAVDNGVIDARRLYIDVLSDERERADTVGPYGKSLLYLVSRALETVHKMPLLGLEAAWRWRAERQDMWGANTVTSVTAWREFVARHRPRLEVHTKSRERISDGQEMIALAHGSFDNDIEVVQRTLTRIRSSALRYDVENLHGF